MADSNQGKPPPPKPPAKAPTGTGTPAAAPPKTATGSGTPAAAASAPPAAAAAPKTATGSGTPAAAPPAAGAAPKTATGSGTPAAAAPKTASGTGTPAAAPPRTSTGSLAMPTRRPTQEQMLMLGAIATTGATPGQDTLQLKDAYGTPRTYDLSRVEGTRLFGLSFGLPAPPTIGLADAIFLAPPGSRVEIALIAQAWARAEKSLAGTPPRLLLNGQDAGAEPLLDPLIKLADALPRGAETVVELHLAGCYENAEKVFERVKPAFPACKVFWAYEGVVPVTSVKSSTWERAAHGRKEDLQTAMGEASRSGEQAAVFHRRFGLLDTRPKLTLEQLWKQIEERRPVFEKYDSGGAVVEDPEAGELRDYYELVQELHQHPKLEPEKRSEVELHRDQTLRLLYYPKIAKRFAAAYGSQIETSHRQLGLPVPDFRKLTRAEAVAAISDFEVAMQSGPPPAAAVELWPWLNEGLRQLDPLRIPASWL